MTSSEIKKHVPAAALEQYVARKVLPRMKLSNTPFILEPTTLGNRNRIFFLHIGSDRTLILKGFAKKRRLQNSLIAARFLARCNLNAPAVFFSDTSDRTRRALGYYFCCEEKVDGSTLADAPDLSAVLPAVASFYARMHTIQSSRWGKLTSGHKFGFTRYIMDKASKRLARVEKSCAELAGSHDLQACLAWFRAHQHTISNIRHFSLCHSDVNSRNILITNDRQVCIIDNEALKYMPFILEFFRLKLVLCADDRDAQAIFENAYLQHSAPARRDEFFRTRDFFHAYVLLEHLCYFGRKQSAPGTPDDLRFACRTRCQRMLCCLDALTRRA
jgi:Ser/Thr protein kinase RdoA (MazF antagonist)